MRLTFALRALGMIAPLLALFVASAGCAPCGGTETGNCGSALTGSASDAAAPPRPAILLRSALCSKLAECHTDLSVTACQTGISGVSNIDVEIGVTGGSYATYQGLIDDEALGNLVADSSILNVCVSDLAELTCADPLVQGAWNSGDPTNFTNVETMIPVTPGSCPDVY